MDHEPLFGESLADAKREFATIDLSAIHALGISKTRKDLSGSHTVVTYPPLDALSPIDGNKIVEKLKPGSEVDFYVHVPFCEYPCKFCAYTTLDNRGKDLDYETGYFEALEKEIKMWSEKIKTSGGKVHSLYIGGGTPLALKTGRFEKLLTFLRQILPFSEKPVICVEASPFSTLQPETHRKLEIMKLIGVTRVSIGIQTFNPDALRNSGRSIRGHSGEDEERAVRFWLDSGIPNVNVDMVQDLTPETSDRFENLNFDLSKIANLRPPHLTWYNLRLRPETRYSQLHTPFATEEGSLIARLALWNFLERTGYSIPEGDRMTLNPAFDDPFRKTRGSVDTSLIGAGVSAYSHVPGWMIQNINIHEKSVRPDSRKAVASYIEAMRHGNHAIEKGYRVWEDEYLAGKFALGLKRGIDLKSLDMDMRGLFQIPPTRAYILQVLNPNEALLKAGLLEVDDKMTLRPTRTGRLFENEICRKFYTPRVEHEACANRGIEDPEISQRIKDYDLAGLMAAALAEQRSY